MSHTLGETVPPELIFPAELDVKRQRRASTLVLPESALEHQSEQPRSTRGPVLNSSVKAIRRAGAVGNMEDVVHKLRGLRVK
jgi:hypothetical protein